MRQFGEPAAFRASVDERLRSNARRLGIPAVVVRRQAALERFIVRLLAVAPDRWALKGGLALDTRLRDRARASMDMDLDYVQDAAAAREDLSEAAALDLGDHFGFAIAGSRELRDGDVPLATRYSMECTVAGAPFEVVQVDVTVRPPEVWDVEHARRPGLLAAIGLGPIDVLLTPLERQTAEKLHAYTRVYGGGRSSTRVRDLVDFVLIRLFESVDGARLYAEIEQTFKVRGTHAIPKRLPAPAADWRPAYRAEASRVRITADLTEAHRLAAEWLDPVLAGAVHGRWEPRDGSWVRPGD